ncbi:MAG: sigma 54-interacting transcriptional regulator [Deltaproteobacteria bacterium]|nr:sigma 54-interacting transcriptional regulator [Deltaproteobacteria bacterium]
MPPHTIFDPKVLQIEIQQSHIRSREYGIDPNKLITPNHTHLSHEELEKRRRDNPEFFEIGTRQMEELYSLFMGAGFGMAITDCDGYILQMVGDRALLEELMRINCCPGYRWTEKDVGTSAIALSHARQIPVQITERQTYCKRGRGYTNSASPIFGIDDRLMGVIVITGRAEQVHSHTLGMMITAARSIESQLSLLHKSRELMLRNSYMNAIIESIDSGVMAVNRDGTINQINAHGKQILQLREDPIGWPVNRLMRDRLDLDAEVDSRGRYLDQECFFRNPLGTLVQALTTLKPIFGPMGKVRGFIIVFNEINRIRKIVNEMAGSQAQFTFEDIIGISQAVQAAKKKALQAAQSKSTVMLTGETGTGKELFAQAIHNQSDRSNRPFVAINCGAIPRELLESELFGYSGGAFTGARKGGRPGKFELANRGTVFLDEIGDMPRDMQVKLLRVLQSGEVIRVGEHNPLSVDVRIIAATHVDLQKEVINRNFREDLFYRLNVFPIPIPPLRNRPEDITVLANHILNRCRQTFKKPKVQFSSEAENILRQYPWPGNVRELENVVERAVNFVDKNLITPEHLDLIVSEKADFDQAACGSSLLEEAEKRIIAETMKKTNHNIAGASKMLGITRPTLYRKLKKYNLRL